MATARQRFGVAIDKILVPVLTELGYVGKAPFWHRVTGEFVHLFHFQGSLTPTQGYVNIGAHPAFAPTIGCLEAGKTEAKPREIRSRDCAFSWRLLRKGLGAGRASEEIIARLPWARDFADVWPYGDTSKDARAVVRQLVDHVLEEDNVLRQFSIDSTTLRDMTLRRYHEFDRPESILFRRYGGRPSPTRYALAAFHERLGNLQEARRFAKHGLTDRDSHVGKLFRPCFEELLKRLEGQKSRKRSRR